MVQLERFNNSTGPFSVLTVVELRGPCWGRERINSKGRKEARPRADARLVLPPSDLAGGWEGDFFLQREKQLCVCFVLI